MMSDEQLNEFNRLISVRLEAFNRKLDANEPIVGEALLLADFLETNIHHFDEASQAKFVELIPKLRQAANKEFTKGLV